MPVTGTVRPKVGHEKSICVKSTGEKIIENKIIVFRYQDMKEDPGKIYDNSSLP
jgi:hypothetical protein